MTEIPIEPAADRPPGEPAPASVRPSASWLGPILWLSLPIVVIDQVTKAIVRAHLPLYASHTVVPGLLDFTHVQNTGAAFGLLNTADFAFKSVLIASIATAALIGIAVYAARLSPHQRVARIGLALVLGGATGNLIDRFTAGYVIDFVDAYWRGYHFWAFNVADSGITIGVVMMMLDMLGLGSHASKTV
jgi:signal peptidase II